MSDSDVMDSSTQVPAVRCVWVPMTLSYHARHSMSFYPEDPAPVALPVLKAPGCGCRGSEYILSQIMRRVYSG
jgi:hypothetical protein